MKKLLFFFLAVVISLSSQSIFSQSGDDAPALNLPGDNLDLYAVLTLFQKSKTIEEFETALNKKETGINNLDLNLDKKVDFIKVTTTKKDNSFTFVLQDAVSKSETQDVAVILVNKDKNGKVSIQCVGDEDLYGKNYVIEPKSTPAVTANPAYQGSNPVTVSAPATTVVVESAPIVQYVYSPAYVPYYPPYYYGYYPPYFAAFTVLAVGIYRHNNWYHGGYYGGHYSRNTVIINNNNRNSINHYNNNRNRSNTVANNNRNGNYGNRAGNTGVSNRMSNNGAGNRAGVSDRASNGAGNRASSANRPSAGTSDRSSSFDRPSAGTSNRSSSNFNSGGRTRSSGGSSFSGGGGGFHGGGGGFGGGGRRR
ncbi:hypothetical protein [Flavobacterium sp. 245]|uniref:hypothetical protein n=1 Tax=Flavobacterium sp. 245 TaxID=2512115 RepID=UPI00105C5D1F|nr:hypothetical protein [Flavobacterium sp. 245]TDP02247.1 hypothetical protein EV145_103228 [Flavobacterium sp. 245]